MRHLLVFSVLLVATISAMLLMQGCNETGVADSGKPKVIATTGMIADIVREVGGDKIEVKQLMKAGIDPHGYQPTRSDMSKMSEADLIFFNGMKLEGKMTQAFVQMGRKGISVWAVSEQLDESDKYFPAGAEGYPDPHVWMNVALWSKAVDVVLEALIAEDPDNAAYYRANAKAYQEKLAELDTYVKEVLSTIPKEQRVMITAHDAFNYMKPAYDLEVRGVQGISTENEAGLMAVRELTDYIVERKIQAVFVETSVSEKNITSLIERAKSQGHELKIGGTIFSDAMGKEGTYEGTYIGMIDHNATTIANALGGKAPEKGFQGKLTGVE